MFTSDSDTVEVIMNELSRLYADASFNPGPKTCHKCGVVFRQMNRHQSFCSSRCKDDYDRGMADWR
jgi:protein-arginine kinase activator protein McsA